MTAFDQAVMFVSRLHRHRLGLVEITALKPAARPCKRWFQADAVADAVAYAYYMNEREYSVFVNVNPRANPRARDIDVAAVGALALDFDFKRINPTGILDLMRSDDIEPSMRVRSGHGLHVYLQLERAADPARARTVAARLCAFTGSDRIHNPSRIMRLAPSVNWKPPAAWCLLDAVSDRLYDLDAVDRWLDARGAPPARVRSDRAEVLVPVDPPADWPDLRLRLSGQVCDAIDFGMQNGAGQETRSHTDWMVVCELVRCGATDDQIRWVYQTQQIGTLKYREAGDHYLRQTIKEARRHGAGRRAA